MDVRYTRDQAGLATLRIVVEPEKVDEVYKRAMRDLRRHVNVPGFRPGRVPPRMVESVVGKEAILDYSRDLFKEQIYPQALAEVPSLIPLEEPELDIETFELGNEAILVAKVPSAEVSLGEYSGLAVDRYRAAVTDEQVNEVLERRYHSSAEVQPAEHDTLATGDVATLALREVRDGVLIEDYSDAQPLRLIIGANSMVPNIDDQLIGLQVGEEKTFEATYPEDYREPEVAGKVAEYVARLIDIGQLESTDAWLERATAFKTMDEARETVHEAMVNQLGGRYRLMAREAAVRQAVEAATVDYPRADLDAAVMEEIEAIEDDLRQRGAEQETIDEIIEAEEESIRERVTYDRRREVVLRALAQVEGIELDREDIAREIGMLSEANGVDPKLLMRRLEEQGTLGEVARNARLRKASEWLLEHALVTEVEAPAPEASVEHDEHDGHDHSGHAGHSQDADLDEEASDEEDTE